MKIIFFLVIIVFFLSCKDSTKSRKFINESQKKSAKNQTILTRINENKNLYKTNKSNQDVNKNSSEKIRTLKNGEVKEILIKFLNLFKEDFVSMLKIEDFLGQSLEEEEAIFFKECDSKNTYEKCNQLFDKCLESAKDCESSIFKEIKKNELTNIFLVSKNRTEIINTLKKISPKEYHSNLNNIVIKFLFTIGEDGSKLIIRDFYIKDKSIYRSLF